jgi:endonuclease/exonuclease/phosphatase family metal-dependent hydrolase
MTTRNRITLAALCLLLLAAAASVAAAATVKFVSADAALSAVNTQQMKSALMYVHPDVLALQQLPNQAGGGRAAVESMARSMGMYFAYEPAYSGADFGSAILSRYPIAKSAPLSGSAMNKLLGMKADLRIGRQIVKVALVRPRDVAEATYSESVVAKLAKEAAKHNFVLMASFDSKSAMSTVKAWGREGLQDAAVVLRSAQMTYPAGKPTERLDYILINPAVRPHLKTMGVVKNAQLRGTSGHIPLQLTLTY